MTRSSGRPVPTLFASGAAILATALFGLIGCAGPDTGTGDTTGATSTTADHAARDAMAIDIDIADGAVTPVNAQSEARVGEPITLVVDSDTDDELHVHASPEHTFAVRVGADQRFTFTVEVPGRVDVELHDANVTVTTISVRP